MMNGCLKQKSQVAKDYRHLTPELGLTFSLCQRAGPTSQGENKVSGEQPDIGTEMERGRTSRALPCSGWTVVSLTSKVEPW